MLNKYYFPDTETGGDEPKKETKPAPASAPVKKVEAPEGYKPLTVPERQQWNDFLDYVSSKGFSGNPELDKRDQSIGVNLMNQYKKSNPNFSLTPADVQRIQYEQYMLRKGDSFPTLSNTQLAYVRNGLNPAYMKRDISGVDNWLGSLTSKEYYPTSETVNGDNKIQHGTNFEHYVATAGIK